MSTSTSVIKHTLAAIAMPSKIGDKIIRAQSIVAHLTGNSNFPVASWPGNVVSLTQLNTDVNALVNAETAAKNHTGTVAARNVALATVINDLRSIESMVQLKADANPSNAANLILSAGYVVRISHSKQKQHNEAQNTQVLGTVLLKADGAGYHQWQMSKDKTSITDLAPTSTAHTTVTGLHTGDVWYFRNKKIDTAKASYNWCGWIELTVGSGGKNTGINTTAHSGSLPTE